MTAADLQSYFWYVGLTAIFYLVPLLASRRAKSSAEDAAKIVVATMALVAVATTVLYPLGAGLVGQLSIGDYLLVLLFYLAPGMVVACLWFLGLRLTGRRSS